MSFGLQRAPSDEDEATLVSLLTPTSHLGREQGVVEWLEAASLRHPLRLEPVAFRELGEWRFEPNPLRLVHRSGYFFRIEGLQTVTDFGPVSRWDQPIIHQPEIGILGILTRVVDGVRHFLMQAKSEPGNVSGHQLAPTLQATRSNFRRVHGGQPQHYAEYFTGLKPVRTIVDQVQSEQGSRFLGKRNRNVIVESDEDVPVEPNFRWMTLGEIKRALLFDNIVNMDTRSILSCLALLGKPASSSFRQTLGNFGIALLDAASPTARPRHSMREIVDWICRMRATHYADITPRGLDQLQDWVLGEHSLRHVEERYFSVIGVRVKTGGREVPEWAQPLLSHRNQGLNGLLTQRFDGVLHFLIRACFYPGNRNTFDLGPTVSRSDYKSLFGLPGAPPFLDLFRAPDPSTVRFSAVQSEEGGRFYAYQNQYMILELPPGTISDPPEEFRWMTFGQIQELLPHGYFSIEARNLLACLQFVD